MVHSVLWLRLFLPQDLFIYMESDCQAPCSMTLCSKIVVMYVFSIFYVWFELMMTNNMIY